MRTPTQRLQQSPPEDRRGKTRVGPLSMWFAASGGMVAWGIHLLVAWSIMEVGCLDVRPSEVFQGGSGPPPTATWVVYGATLGPWLIALAAVLVSLRLWPRVRRARDHLAGERLHLLLVLGLTLDILGLLAISGGVVAEFTLRACS